MFAMTVHGDRSRFPSSEKGNLRRGPVLVNGQKKLEGPMLENLTFSRSWNGCTWQLHTQESPSVPNGDVGHSRSAPIQMTRESPFVKTRDSPLAKSRESPVSLGSCTSSGDRNKFLANYRDDDSITTASSNLDSTETEEEYVTLDRSYVFPRSFRTPTHHSSMIDLKHNSLYSPKVTNQELANQNCKTLPNKKFRQPLRSVSVDETDLDAVDIKSFTGKKSLWKIYENIGDTLKQRLTPQKAGAETVPVFREDLHVVKNESDDNPFATPKLLHRNRSQSVNDLKLLNGDNDDESHSDEDGDDFGFLSYPFVHSSVAMHKAKPPSPHHRILPKRWRSKAKPSNSPGSCLWSPEGACTWCNVSGRRVEVPSVSLLQLTEVERLTLQKICLAKLQAIELGCPVVVPKEHSETGRRKKHMLSFKRSKSANLSGLIHGLAEKEKENKELQHSGLVFGIPLAKCIANEAELQRKKSSGPLREKKDTSDVIIHRQGPRKSSSSSQGSTENYTQNGSSCPNESQKRTASSDSLSESESRNTSSSLIDALSLSMSRQGSLKQNCLPLYATGAPQVPQIVNNCFKHIETYGLRVLGIFRVGCSKKRTKQIDVHSKLNRLYTQMRDEFDSGRDIKLNESHNPHEVGSLLKEYFRDLPEPLMTRDLYSPLVATRSLEAEVQMMLATRLLIALLPVPNRDTLWALLEFLSKVDAHSRDDIDESGQTLPGNKMDVHNLATLFGPNILHKAKASEKEFNVESMERAEERKEVIDVVKFMIKNHHSLFKLPASTYDEVLQSLVETDPDAVEQILRRLSNDSGIEADPDTTSSSLFEDGETASLPHSPVSDPDFKNRAHTPLRVAKSAEVLTPCSRRKFFYSQDSDPSDHSKRRMENSEPEPRPKFHLRIEPSPSPPEPVRTRNTRTPKVKVTRDSSKPDYGSRPRSVHLERPHSDVFTQNLAIPAPDYMRHHSGSTDSSNNQSNTSLNSPVRSDSFGNSSGLPRSSSSSPRMTSSRQRPLDLRRTVERDPNVGSGDWQRDRWQQWKDLSSGQTPENYDQETLV